MHYIFGGNNALDNKITNEFNDQAKLTLKAQFCQFCNKAPSTKVAFVPEIKRGFTCNNCQLNAVGNDFKNLGDKTLITNQKLSETITKALINYQMMQHQSPHQIKDIENELKNHIKTSHESVEKIKTEVKLFKSSCQNKVAQLIKQSEQQNSIVLFQELNRKSKQKKVSAEQISELMCKKSLVNRKGLHFMDEESIQSGNSQIDQRLGKVKQEMKLKLKQIDDLVEWVNKIQL